jgi:DNA-binding transcriptional LysR family regulator
MKISDSPEQDVPADTSRDSSARPRMPWTDFHLILCVNREGSVAKACGALGMTHSTLLRKLDLIESRLKTRLFERVRGRYTLTPAGHEIEQAALAFEPLARAAETRARGQDLRPNGHVRVSAASIVIDQLMPPVLAQFASAFPDVQIELTASRDHVSLRRREADVAIRIADEVPDWLVGRKLADLRFKVYGRRRGRSKVPLRSFEQLADERRWISFERDASDMKFDRWLAAAVPDANVLLRIDNFAHAATLVRAGLGVAVLPQFVEGSLPDLQPLSPPIPALDTPLWLVTHPELKNTTRIQVLMRAFGPALANAVRAVQSSRELALPGQAALVHVLARASAGSPAHSGSDAVRISHPAADDPPV